MDKTYTFKYLLKLIKPEGWLAYEYNPLHNYRSNLWVNSNDYSVTSDTKQDGYLAPGTLLDFDTEASNLGFSIRYPVDILTQQSYDGSINLILNDNLNKPRMINSRFTVRSQNKYQIVDRTGSTDTNIYDANQFDIDTSLYKIYNTIPEITFNGIKTGGNLKVGNYVFYFKLCDSDGNETDFVGESGIVTCYIGNVNDPKSTRGGISDENSFKSVSFSLIYLDSSYDYVKVYYTRSTSTPEGTETTTAHVIDQKYRIIGDSCHIYITGQETIEDISIDEINITYFLADKVKAQAIVQNRLFLGGLHKPTVDYEDFRQISLRILPKYKRVDRTSLIGNLNNRYIASGGFMYYDSQNIYNYLGYWNTELYRIGIVYILNDGSLSQVFNIRGGVLTNADSIDGYYKYADYTDDNAENKTITVLQDNSLAPSEEFYGETQDSRIAMQNGSGVIRISDSASGNTDYIYGLQFYIPEDVINFLDGKIKGFFFVRQKRIPGILAQAMMIGNSTESGLPTIPVGSNIGSSGGETQYIIEGFLGNEDYLNVPKSQRWIKLGDSSVELYTGLCPEFELRQPYFNNLFTGTEFPISVAKTIDEHQLIGDNTEDSEQFYYTSSSNGDNTQLSTVSITAVADNIEAIRSNNYTFRARAGQAEEAYKVETVNDKPVRGSFGPYLGIENFNGNACDIINIYRPGYTLNNNYENFQQQYTDNSAYYAISQRYDFTRFKKSNKTITDAGNTYYETDSIYRGDCFICQYTHRINRNFQDPEAPTNDKIVNTATWKENYVEGDNESNANINRGDINAIQLGSWITFTVRSNINLSMRNWDDSYPTEFGLTGLNRGFYPLQNMSTEGNYKIPESFMSNAGLSSTTSDKYNFLQPEVPYIKNNFDTRIAYSDIAVNDAFKNGLRVFQATSYRDYPIVYGGITKLLEFAGQLFCIFEHGVALIPVNERVVAGSGAGGDAFINTSNVLPENPNVLSDMYGTQWPESVIKTPYYIYGVDTVAKKIWRTNGQNLEVISDFSMAKFLIDNITLGERELTPIIGVRNVKTHYNAYKNDVMFTFYDNLNGFEEKVWNLCWNEQLQKWTTFYSWVPSYSTNIDNQYYSFDRDTSKIISKLAIANEFNPDAEGITVGDSDDEGNIISDNVITDQNWNSKLHFDISDLVNLSETGITATYSYSLEGGYKNLHKYFEIDGDTIKLTDGGYEEIKAEKYIYLNIKADVTLHTSQTEDYKDYYDGFDQFKSYNAGYFEYCVAFISKDIYDNNRDSSTHELEVANIPVLTTDFWKHGQGGIIDIQDEILPCYWYGQQHPFEFEFVVNQDPGKQKIWTNLQIISNKVQPESIHYSIFGDSYEFSKDKKNMFVRQELTKMLYQNLGSDILYNHDIEDVLTKMYKLSPRSNDKGDVDGNRDIVLIDGLTKNEVSTIFPLYYEKIDSFNEIYHYYQILDGEAIKDYQNLSGTEVTFDSTAKKFGITVHQKCVDMQKYGRIRGNLQYQEDLWRIQIPSIIYQNKNESTTDWLNNYPPITILQVPNDIKDTVIDETKMPTISWNNTDIKIQPLYIQDVVMGANGWTARKETRLRDKFIKIRVRYSGNELVTIQGITTDFTISNA